MNLPRMDEVKPTLGRIEDTLSEIIKWAWKEWMNNPLSGMKRYARTRAAVIFDLIINKAQDVFRDVPGIVRLKGHETESYIVDDQVLFRFKMGNSKGLSCNIPTQTALAFNDHSIDTINDHQGRLFEEINPARVEIVYTLNKLKTDIKNIFVVGRDKDKIIWAYDIIPQAVIEEFPTPTIQRIPPEQLIEAISDENEGEGTGNNEAKEGT